MAGQHSISMRPRYDADARELRVGDRFVKQFFGHAPNQIAILMAFEEEGWPVRIDDPLPQRAGIDPRDRLHDAIKRLNRNQIERLIVFSGDGTGQGVRWRLAN